LGVLGYNIYRATTSGGAYTKVSSTLLTVLSYADGTVTSGKTYYYVVTAVGLTGAESAHSTQVSATIP
jgi:fibronectin type 3 domain-containing protein